MPAPGLISGRNLVVASLQTNVTHPYPVFQVSDLPPAERPNGGDLVDGDTYYSTFASTFYLYMSGSWVEVGGQGLITALIDELASVGGRLSAIETSLHAANLLDIGDY